MENYNITNDEEKQIVTIQITGRLEPENIARATSRVNSYLDKMEHRRLVVDLSLDRKTGKMTSDIRQGYRQYLGSMNFEKIAIIGASPAIRILAKVALAVSGKKSKAKFFKTKEEASTWLTS